MPTRSDKRGVPLPVRHWQRKRRLPDAIVTEHLGPDSDHQGAARIADLGDPRFDGANVIPPSRAFLRGAGLNGGYWRAFIGQVFKPSSV